MIIHRPTDLSNTKCIIWELQVWNCVFANVSSWLWPWFLKVLLPEILNNLPTIIWCQLRITHYPFAGSYGFQTAILPILSHVTLTVRPQISGILKTPKVSLFDWQNFLPGTIEWSYNSKTAVSVIFISAVMLIFNFWTSNLKNLYQMWT